jgi:sugar-specific transcriptional regulator TrmB
MRRNDELSQEQVMDTLMSFGLTRIDAKIYILIAKKGPQKAVAIGRAVKTSKPQLYRSLKNLESRGIVSATLEHPAKFSALPFEKALDLLAKAKMKKALEEAQHIQETKQDILANWQRISMGGSPDESEKFMVIEGRDNIYARIQQMITDSRSHVSTITTVPNLIRASQFGVFDTGFKPPLKSKIRFRLLTQMSEQYIPAMKGFLKEISDAELNFEGRNPDLGLKLSPRLIIRDEDEIMLFITSKTDAATGQDNVGLWTNCKDLVQAFTATFEDNWCNSTDIQQSIRDFEAGKPEQKAFVSDEAAAAKKKWKAALRSAKEEIVLMTSCKGLLGYLRSTPLLRECAKRGVSVRIMTPVTSENVETVQQLSEFCEVKHVPIGHLETTIVDGKHLFQLADHFEELEKQDMATYFGKTFYKADLPYVERMACMLNSIWKSASAPSPITLDSIIRPTSDSAHEASKEADQDKLSAKSGFGGRVTIGRALIHAPRNLDLPEMMIQVQKSSKASDFGDSDTVIFALCLPTPASVGGFAFVPVAVVDTSPRPVPMWRALFAGTPAGQNVIVVKPEQLEVWKQGNTLFAGWTVPLPLLPPKYSLPPSCVLFEGIGSAKHQKTTTSWPSGFKTVAEYDNLEAFVTFINPSSNYAGPGTDGSLGTNVVATTTPPEPTENGNLSKQHDRPNCKPTA